MKNSVYILLLVNVVFGIHTVYSQSAFQNSGNVQIHEGGEIGFHTNLVNNGNFDQNLGLVGFYNLNGNLTVSGANSVAFNDVEIGVYDDLYLETSVVVTNNLSFITGSVLTPKANLNVLLEFSNYNVYMGEGDDNFVDGYVTSTNNDEFTFPIGDANALRPMLLPIQPGNSTYIGAYFNEDPNNPSTFPTSFDTSKKQDVLGAISETEFWDLNGSIATQIILTWDNNSDILDLTNNMASLRVVGWDKFTEKWVDLGGEKVNGDLYNGWVQSASFVPDNYEIITIGVDFTGVGGKESCFEINSFSPNGDGINDYLVIEGIELRPNNTLKILNRWGAMVYSKDGYDNTWGGISEHKLTIGKGNVLPQGTYFYILKFHDEGITCTGYIYLKK